MTRTAKSLILPALLIEILCAAASAGSLGNCVSYERAVVRLTGRIIIKVFPGPPNYASVEEGDKPEPAWILHLTKPICIKADKDDEFNVAEDKVSDIHLVLDGNQFRQLRPLMRKGAVTLTGTLFHAFNAHHHANVLMRVRGIKRQ